ncbi:hypothetical protein BKA62DRAFT_830228 [Auriculariales sp. MPI-PUGE-AT-0066]|nr:hypothetical protein BKA62DRAFT_830228 [Auriculariales sp. MPI-PUGE-AT-0066]
MYPAAAAAARAVPRAVNARRNMSTVPPLPDAPSTSTKSRRGFYAIVAGVAVVECAVGGYTYLNTGKSKETQAKAVADSAHDLQPAATQAGKDTHPDSQKP